MGDVDQVEPSHKRVEVAVKGTHFDSMAQSALLEAANFLQMDIAELKVYAASTARVTQMTRFVPDLSHERFPEEWQIIFTVGVNITDPDED